MSALTPAQQRIHAAALKLFAERGVTQVNVSELAQAAGVARGTIYNNLTNLDRLFEEVAAELSEDMNRRITEGFQGVADPALRMSFGVRLYVRRVHEEPHWGRFITRFAASNVSLQRIWQGQPVIDMTNGLQSGRFHFRPEQLASTISLLAGAVLGASFMVLEGIKTWREAGADAAELLLIALGVPRAEARELAAAELPPLPPSRLG